MEQDKGKLHPNAGNTSSSNPSSGRQHPPISNSKNEATFPTTTSLQTMVPSGSRNSKFKDLDTKSSWKNRTFRSSLEIPHQPETKDSVLKRYRQAPESDFTTYAQGFLAWPSTELPVVASGSRKELDDIRLQLQCHIVYDKEMQVFKIFSAGRDGINGKEAVESAMVDIRKKLLQKGSGRVDALKILLAQLPKDHTFRLVREYAADNKLIKGASFEKQDAVIRLKKIDGAQIPADWQAWSKKLESTQVDIFRLAMLDRLQELYSVSEDIHLRVRIGMCVFKNYLWESEKIPDLPVKAFVECFELDKTDAVLCSLNDDALLLKNILQRNDLIRGPNSKDLAMAQPIYEILFDVASKGEPKATHQLHISTSLKEGAVTLERNWRKFIDRNRVGQALEIFMVRFGGQQSWKLQVDATPRVSIPGDQERNFAASVKLKDQDTKTKSPLDHHLRFDFQPNSNIRAMRQKTIWRTNMRSNARWIVEIAKYDNFVRNQFESAWTADSPRWDVSMYHRKWNMVSGTSSPNDDNMISSLLAPDVDNLVANEAVKSFCHMMAEVSDSLSFWSHSAV